MTNCPLRGLIITSLALFLSAPGFAGQWSMNQSVQGTSVDIYVPDTLSPIGNNQRALLIVLHGCGQARGAYSANANLDEAAERWGMVVAVPEGNNLNGLACWQYWSDSGQPYSRNAGDYRLVLDVTRSLRDHPDYQVDPAQVYIAGLSAGAAFANTLGCLAPDIYSGMGIVAGPSIGTSSNGAIGSFESAPVASRCINYAANYATEFATQIAAFTQGQADYTVSQNYLRQNAEGLAAVYGVEEVSITAQTREGFGFDHTTWSDNRVDMTYTENVGHAWPAGAGATGGYIAANGFNYGDYLGEYFSSHNQRVSRNQAPELSGVTVGESNGSLLVNGYAADADGTVTSVDVAVDALPNGTAIANLQSGVDSSGHFSLVTDALPDGLYRIRVSATDDLGATSAYLEMTQRVGPEPAATAPELTNTRVEVDGRCAEISGSVTDANQDLNRVEVTIGSFEQTADVNGTQHSTEFCQLPGGDYTAIIIATDSTQLSSSTSIDFSINGTEIATLAEHISAGRLDYTAYASCYLEYGFDPFSLSEVEQESQCYWQDIDGSCSGPLQACSGTGGENPGGGTDCVEAANYNFFHRAGGRAYSTGNRLSPDYFAAGSNDPLPGSTWGYQTLHSLDADVWHAGSCPE